MNNILIWSGTTLTFVGLAILVFCIVRVARAKRAGLDPEALSVALQKVVPLNLGALFISAIGLMLVIVGIVLS